MSKRFRLLALGAAFIATLTASAQSWTPLTTQPSFNAGVSLLLTDGMVMVHNIDTQHWWRLTPDANGNYVNGTWTQLHDMDPSYGPRFFASAVLADGRVFVMGGEYNFLSQIWINHGEVYDPQTNLWTVVSPPSGWSNIGDAQCVVFPNGKLMMANPFGGAGAILDPTSLTWSFANTSGKQDRNDEEGWVLLPDGTVLTVDASNGSTTAEKYDIALDEWVSAGNVPSVLENGGSNEIGPGMLLPNGTVFAMGGTQSTAIYTPPGTPTDPGSWVAGPDFPVNGSSQQLDMADGASCLLPNGNVLAAASPGVFNAPTSILEYDGSWHFEPSTPHASGLPSWRLNMLLLPSGQVLETDFTNDVEVYTPIGGPQNSWRPTISSAPAGVVLGHDYLLQGTQLNGLSQANSYGDDATNATNYPIVEITNNGTGHVFFCRTHDHSTMAVATGGATVSTHFSVPGGTELGDSTLTVIANGIPSAAQAIYVDTVAPTANAGSNQTVEATGPSTSFTLDGTASSDSDGDAISSYQWFDSLNSPVGTGSTLTLSRGLGTYTFSLVVTDAHGVTSAPSSVQIKIQDTTPPAFSVLPDISVADASNTGTVVNFGPFYANDLVDGSILGTGVPASGATFPPGSTLVTVSATDNSGNTGYGYFHVNVTYSWSGFLSPFPKQVYKMGSNIPIKFMLTGASAGISNLVATGYWNNGGPNHLIGSFVYDPVSLQYQLQFKTTGVPKGPVNIVVTFDDGTTHTIQVILK